MHCKVFSTDQELTLAGTYWQKQLRLEDWNVTFTLKTCGGMPGGGHDEGATRIWIKRKEAAVSVLRFDNYPSPDEYDMEQCLVHELLHLHFDPYFQTDEKSLIHIAQEQTIDQVAATLVRLNRGLRR